MYGGGLNYSMHTCIAYIHLYDTARTHNHNTITTHPYTKHTPTQNTPLHKTHPYTKHTPTQNTPLYKTQPYTHLILHELDCISSHLYQWPRKRQYPCYLLQGHQGGEGMHCKECTGEVENDGMQGLAGSASVGFEQLHSL